MKVLPNVAAGWYGMYVNIKDPVLHRLYGKPGFFLCFPGSNAQYVRIPVAMPARLEPFVKLEMMNEQGVGPFRIHDPRRSGNMTFFKTAFKAHRIFLNEVDGRIAECLLFF